MVFKCTRVVHLLQKASPPIHSPPILSLSRSSCTFLSIYLLASIPPHPRTPLRFARDNDSGGTPYSREYRGREV